jgi:hypothetical protein
VAEIIIEFPTGIKKYPMPDGVTHREAAKIKATTGLRLGEIGDALERGDPDVVLAFALIAAARVGDIISEDSLWDLELGAIRMEGDDDEEDPTAAADEDAAGDEKAATTRAKRGRPTSPESTD